MPDFEAQYEKVYPEGTVVISSPDPIIFMQLPHDADIYIDRGNNKRTPIKTWSRVVQPGEKLVIVRHEFKALRKERTEERQRRERGEDVGLFGEGRKN